VIFQFRDSASVDVIDETIRNLFRIKQNQLYALSYADKDTGENIYLMADGEQLSECVMMGIEMFDVNIHSSEFQLPSGKLYTRFIFTIRCRLFEKYLLSVI
jgi:hypothetical protein